MCPPPTSVIFDLDGTLVQTREASWKVFEPISRRHRLGIDAAEKFYALFAGNFFQSIRESCQTEEVADVVTAEFMAALDEHYSPAMVPGLIDVVKAMVPFSKLAVLSSNTTGVVRRVLRANGLEYCFAHVFGGDVEPDKTKGIGRFMADAASGSGRLCRAYYDEPADIEAWATRGEADPRLVVLVTDTVGDVEAASRAGIRAVGVAWGMHTEEQLLAAGAEFVAIWPQELLAHLYGRAEESCSCAVPGPSQRTVNQAQSAAAQARRNRRRSYRTSARDLRPATPAVAASGTSTATTAATTPAEPPPIRRFSDPLLAEAIRRTLGVAPTAPPTPVTPPARVATIAEPTAVRPLLADAIARTIR